MSEVGAAWTDEQREAHIREHPSPPGPADVPFLLRLLDAERAKVARVKALMEGTPRRIKGEEGESCEPHTYVLEAAVRRALSHWSETV